MPFRKCYGCLGEMTSLIPAKCKFVILTATPTKSTQAQILETLNIRIDQCHKIEHNPDRPNLFYTFQYLDKDIPLEEVFASLIQDIKRRGAKTERTVIYCKTRKQCSVLYLMFQFNLQEQMFHGECNPRNRVVDMFHAGTPKPVKEHISSNMALDDGHLRVLIGTVAFGMGVNCKKVRRTIHFGPSKNI